jgi:hypothetical protein
MVIRHIARGYCLAVGLFFLVRAGTTLLGGADFGLPGTGWRSVFQLAAVVILVVGLLRPGATTAAVVTVAVVYTLATVLELFHGTDLLGVIPVDGRDRIVHPLVALLGYACVALSRVRPRDPALPAGTRPGGR